MAAEKPTLSWLTGSNWVSIPVLLAHPATLVAEFFEDGTGRTTYERFGNMRTIPDLFDVDWGWRIDPASPTILSLKWPDGTDTQIAFRLEDVEFTVRNQRGEPTTFTSKLLTDAQLFPLGSDFPDGWPPEYFGYPTKIDL
jgi:hypothetical protein